MAGKYIWKSYLDYKDYTLYDYTEDLKEFQKTNFGIWNGREFNCGGINIYNCNGIYIAITESQVYKSTDKINFEIITDTLNYKPTIYGNPSWESNDGMLPTNVYYKNGKIYYQSESAPNKFFDLIEFDGVTETLYENIFYFDEFISSVSSDYYMIWNYCSKIDKFILFASETNTDIKYLAVTDNLTNRASIINIEEMLKFTYDSGSNGYIFYPDTHMHYPLYLNQKYILPFMSDKRGYIYTENGTDWFKSYFNDDNIEGSWTYGFRAEKPDDLCVCNNTLININSATNTIKLTNIDENNNLYVYTYDLPLTNNKLSGWVIKNNVIHILYSDEDAGVAYFTSNNGIDWNKQKLYIKYRTNISNRIRNVGNDIIIL